MKAKELKISDKYKGFQILEIVRKDDKVIIMFRGNYGFGSMIFDKEEEVK